MLTDKEKMELLNLRKKVVAQKEEIKRLQKQVEHIRDSYNAEIATLRTRCYIGAEEYFDKKMYGVLKIVTVGDRNT